MCFHNHPSLNYDALTFLFLLSFLVLGESVYSILAAYLRCACQSVVNNVHRGICPSAWYLLLTQLNFQHGHGTSSGRQLREVYRVMNR